MSFILLVVTIVLAVLEFMDIIDIGWFMVFSPIWGGLLFILVLSLIFGGVTWGIGKKWGKR